MLIFTSSRSFQSTLHFKIISMQYPTFTLQIPSEIYDCQNTLQKIHFHLPNLPNHHPPQPALHPPSNQKTKLSAKAPSSGPWAPQAKWPRSTTDSTTSSSQAAIRSPFTMNLASNPHAIIMSTPFSTTQRVASFLPSP